jgi:hypothetical protein
LIIILSLFLFSVILAGGLVSPLRLKVMLGLLLSSRKLFLTSQNNFACLFPTLSPTLVIAHIILCFTCNLPWEEWDPLCRRQGFFVDFLDFCGPLGRCQTCPMHINHMLQIDPPSARHKFFSNLAFWNGVKFGGLVTQFQVGSAKGSWITRTAGLSQSTLHQKNLSALHHKCRQQSWPRCIVASETVNA